MGEDADAAVRQGFDDLEERYSDDPRKQQLGIVEFTVTGLYVVSHRGCPFVNTIAELPDRDHPARRLIETHKAQQARRIEALCERAGVAPARESAAELTFLLEGAQIVALNRGVPTTDRWLRKLARQLIERRSG